MKSVFGFLKQNAKKTEEEQKLKELHDRAAARAQRIADVATTSGPEGQPVIEPSAFNVREFERVAVDLPAIVICELDGDTPATIVDISSGGLRVQFEKSYYPEDVIVIESKAFQGFVVASVKWQGGKEAGLEIDREWTARLAKKRREAAA